MPPQSSIVGRFYYAQFVLEVLVEESSEAVTQVQSFLIPAETESEARILAADLAGQLSDQYRNRSGNVVTRNCLGIHRVEEVDWSDDLGRIELGSVCFTTRTTPSQLLSENFDDRADLPELN